MEKERLERLEAKRLRKIEKLKN